MADGADGVGTILTGGLAARAVESVRDGQGHAHAHAGAGGTCLNCGTVRAGAFCQDCGQGGHLHRHVAAIGHDILHGVFHFEGRLWTTLPLLVRRPGELTRRYVHGERVKFVSPMALFLFSVFLLFAAVNRMSAPDIAGAGQGLAKARAQVSDDAEKAQDKLDDLREKRTDALGDNPRADVRALDKRIAEATEEVRSLRTVATNLPHDTEEAARVGRVTGAGKTYNLDLAHGVSDMNVGTGYTSLDKQIEHVRRNPELYAYKLKMASYKYSWALIPISLPFIWMLFFWRRDVTLYDHAIFAIYSLSFMTLLVVGLIGLHLLGVSAGLLWLVLIAVPPIHMYSQLKGAYRLTWAGALWRTAALLLSTSVAGALFFALLLWLEAE